MAALAAACGADPPANVPNVPSSPSSPTSSVALPPAIPLPPGAPVSATTFTMTSEPGDTVGFGLSRTYYLGDGTWTARFDTNNAGGHVAIFIESLRGNPLWFWQLNFGSPKGQPLVPGSYSAARRYPFQGDTQPGLDVVGGSGCNTSTGSFIVNDIKVTAGNLDRFDATFEQHCDGRSPALRGRVVIASDPWR
jgi:hypothetical protein